MICRGTRILAVCLVIIGCSGTPSAPDVLSVTGMWEGTFDGIVEGTGTTQHDDFTMELMQSGTSVSGVLRFGFAALEVPITTGQLDGSLLTYVAAASLGPECDVRIDAELTANAPTTRLEGVQTQATCEGTAVGRVVATRLP